MKLSCILAGALALVLITPAKAQTTAVTAPAAPAAQIVLPKQVLAALGSSPCTPTSCTGWYIGAGIGGIGTSLNVIGNGLNGSLLAGGFLPELNGGYMYADGKWMFGAHVSAAYQTQTSVTAAGVSGNQQGFLLTEGVRFGGNVNQLLGITTPAVTIPPALANSLITLYAGGGVAQHQLPSAGAFAVGAYSEFGALFDIGPHSFVDANYRNYQYGATQNGPISFNNANVVTLSFHYKP